MAGASDPYTQFLFELLHKSQISDLITKQFLYVDDGRWDLLRSEIFAEGQITADNCQGPRPTTAEEIISAWQVHLGGLDAVHHQVGHYLVTLTGEGKAHAIALGSACHYKSTATRGKTRTFAGKYEFTLTHSVQTFLSHQIQGWRISGVKFVLSYMVGNLDLN